MILCNIPLCLVRLLLYRYKSQMLCIKWGSHFSEFFGVSNGVRQGSVLSPYLFALYLNDLSTNLNAIKSGCVIGNALVNHLFFADDLCLLSPSCSGLQDLVDICSSYAVPHNIVFNCKKSVGVLFPSKGFVLSQSPKIVLGNKVINFCDSVTYLGVKISANLSDDEDIFRQVRSSYCAANKLKAKFSKCSYEKKNMLFNCFAVIVCLFMLAIIGITFVSRRTIESK